MNVGDYVIIKNNIIEERDKFSYDMYSWVMKDIIGKQFKIVRICDDSIRIEKYPSFFIPKSAVETLKGVRRRKIKQIFNE